MMTMGRYKTPCGAEFTATRFLRWEEAYVYPLTPCCGASAKGVMYAEHGHDRMATVCRECYAEVHPGYGTGATSTDATRFIARFVDTHHSCPVPEQCAAEAVFQLDAA